jgi:uncharacterized phage infection (PIP) family protein YhgE
MSIDDELGNMEEMQDLILTLQKHITDALEIAEALRDTYGEMAKSAPRIVSSLEKADELVETLNEEFC